MKKREFIFSVVMSVYNVEKFIREAVDSLIHQTIGFENIQLILTDDGSTDQSGRICDEYAAKYPDNVEAHHKANGGLSAARNDGMKHVKGKYVNFLDPDDYVDKDAFEKVFHFMEAHQEVDIACIPMYLFGNDTGAYYLNDKFDNGTRILDLMDEKDSVYVHLGSSSSFYRCESILTMLFDTVVYGYEDALVNIDILMNNPKLAVIADTKYHYRKHGNSIVDRSKYNYRAYMPVIKRVCALTLDKAQSRFGDVPKYVQSMVMNILHWKLKEKFMPNVIIEANEKEDYLEALYGNTFRIDDDIILAQKSLSMTRKLDILCRKHANDPDKARRLIIEHFGEMETGWDFLTLDAETCVLEGYHRFIGVNAENVEPVLLVDGKELLCERVNRKKMREKALEETISDAVGFKAVVPVGNMAVKIVPALRVGSQIIERQEVCYRYFFPVSDKYENASYVCGSHMVTVQSNALVIEKKPAFPVRVVRECKWLKEIWQKNLLGGRKAVAGRIYYHLVKPFKRRQLWILSDRVNKADDNGEALFRYLMEHKPKNTRVVFALRKDSPDRSALEKVGECINPFSLRHKMLHLLCDMEISAQAEIANVFETYNDPLRDLMQHQKFVFLQHGVTQDDVSNWLCRYRKNIRGLVTVAESEYRSFVDDDYSYPEQNIWLTGFPRHDRLYHDEKHVITIMPTWRKYLYGNVDIATGLWQPTGDLTKSRYFKFFSALLSSKKLLDALEMKGYTLQFFPHPNMQAYVDLFMRDPRVRQVPLNTPYRDVFAQSNLVLTDYSSAVFDFAYLRKPVLYCQFDKDEFFAGGHVCTPGYFSYERDGFGEVTYDLESTIDQIIEYVENDCKLKDKYRERIDNFFAFNDQNNCQRVAEKIMEIAR